MTSVPDHTRNSILLVGASRGLGAAMATELVDRGWHVTGTVRSGTGTALHDLAAKHPDRVVIETLDVTALAQIGALRARLSGQRFDILFVNAGTADMDPDETIAETSAEAFMRVMLTNAFGVMRAVEGLDALVRPDGLVGVMSSGQGSVANNQKGGRDAYRASKAALNQLMRSYAARYAADGRARVLLAPGWIRTELGGPDAPFGLDETVPAIIDTLLAQRGRADLRFLDRFGQAVPW